MCFRSEKIGNVDVVTLSGRLDTEKAEKLSVDFDNLDDSASIHTIIMMDSVHYISSSMIRVLLKSLKKHKATGGDLQLVDLQPQILQVIKIAGLDSIFTIREDKESALKSLSE